jgi:hypothetical protein
MALSFLFTGIPGFYKRLGYHVVQQPHFEADAREMRVVATPFYSVRGIDFTRDLPGLMAVHRRAIAGATGAILRTKRTWLDARSWLGDVDKSFAAHRDGKIVAYLRSHCRAYGHRILEAVCPPGHERAIAELCAAMANSPCACGDAVNGGAPDGSAVASYLRTLPSVVESPVYRNPMMVLDLTGDPAIDAAFDNDPLWFWNADRI